VSDEVKEVFKHTQVPHYNEVDPMEAECQLFPELVGVSNLNSHLRGDSSPRVQMANSALGSSLVIKGSTLRRQQTGTEREFAKYTFSKRFENNVVILAVVHRYDQTAGIDSIAFSPETAYIYEDAKTGHVDVMILPMYNCNHQHFGFEYQKDQNVVRQMTAEARIRAGTKVADSPSVTPEGDYKYGLELNMCLMSVEGVIEDGAIFADDVLPKLTAQGFEKRVESCGQHYYMINLYGNPERPDEYKPVPDIGEKIRDDGLLFALRKYDPLLAPIEMSPTALREPDYIYDRLVYATPGATVIDIMVQHNHLLRNCNTPAGMDRQLRKYHTAATNYYRRIWQEYEKVCRRPEGRPTLGYEFNRLLVEARTYLNERHRDSRQGSMDVNKTYRRNELDEWRIEVTYQYDMVPTIGNKITGTHGDKAVICGIWPRANMPVDADGNSADYIMDADSNIKRMNLGRLYEQYFNAASRDVTKKIRQMFGFSPWGNDVPPKPKPTFNLQNALFGSRESNIVPGQDIQLDPAIVAQAWQYLFGYYDIVSPWMAQMFARGEYKQPIEEHLLSVMRDGIYLWMPTHNPIDYVETVQQVQAKYPPCYGPVSFIAQNGKRVVTDAPIMIGSVYVIELEKTGSEWSGVASAKLQHHGIPAKITKMDKYAYPGRASPIRLTGEGEVRLLASTAGGYVAADLVDQSNNPTVHKEITANILRAPQPTNIPKVIDRDKFPLGQGRNILFVTHVLECAGIRFVYKPERPQTPPSI